MNNLYLAFQLHERVLSLEKLVASHQLQLSVVKSELATMQHDIDIINAVKHQLDPQPREGDRLRTVRAGHARHARRGRVTET